MLQTPKPIKQQTKIAKASSVVRESTVNARRQEEQQLIADTMLTFTRFLKYGQTNHCDNPLLFLEANPLLARDASVTQNLKANKMLVR